MADQLVYVLLGLGVTALVVVLGHSYWAWRRSRGPLRSADQDVAKLTNQDRRR
jgi:hypothetical protein